MSDDERADSQAQLWAAIGAGDTAGVQAALAAGADPNLPDAKGGRVLHGTVARGQLDLIELLLDAGADLEARDDGPYGPLTPVLLAAIYGQADALERLIARGAKVNASVPDSEDGHDRVGWTAAHFAASEGRLDMLAALIRVAPELLVYETADRQRPYALCEDRLCKALLLTVAQGRSVDEFLARVRGS